MGFEGLRGEKKIPYKAKDWTYRPVFFYGTNTGYIRKKTKTGDNKGLTMQPHLLSFLFAIILILRKLHYDIEFYNERRQAKVGLLRYMMRFDSLGFMFPILRSAETQTEQQIISKANRSIYLAYAMLVLTLIIVSTSTI